MQSVFNQNSVIQHSPTTEEALVGEVIMRFISAAEDIPAWGNRPAARDKALREFWPTEPILASAMTNMVAKYSSFGWKLTGPERTARIYQRLLQYVEYGQGPPTLIAKVALDLFSQDNGAFIEVVRSRDDPSAPLVSLNHLDSSRCVRTGRPEEPVVYYDLDERPHKLKYYQVIVLAEMPSPIERMRGMQYCAVTRLLRAAQILRDIGIYEREKISGRFSRAIHFVSGVTKRAIDEALKQSDEEANNLGLVRYIQPLILASLDPTSQITKQTIEMATLPDHFNKEEFMRWYINQLALAFATDYQEFAPLPAGNLGSSQQSQILHLKSQGKGPALFITLVERAFNFQGILPNNIHFSFGEQDTDVDIQKAELRTKRAQERAERISSGEITKQIARQMAVDDGDLRPEYLEALNEEDLTPDRHVVIGSRKAEEKEVTLDL